MDVKGVLIGVLLLAFLVGSVWAEDQGQLSESDKQWLRREAQIMARNTRRLRLPEPTHMRSRSATWWQQRYIVRQHVKRQGEPWRYLKRRDNGLSAAQLEPVP